MCEWLRCIDALTNEDKKNIYNTHKFDITRQFIIVMQSFINFISAQCETNGSHSVPIANALPSGGQTWSLIQVVALVIIGAVHCSFVEFLRTHLLFIDVMTTQVRNQTS